MSIRIDKTPAGLNADELKKELLKTIQARLNELQSSSILTELHSSTPASEKEQKKFTSEELKQYDGQAGKPAYFAFEGKVYDTSTSSLWNGGSHMASHNAGKDLTEALKSAPHGDEVFSKTKQVGILV